MVARRSPPESDLPVLALRAEGGPGIGAGHQARCLALAQAWTARKGVAVLVADAVPEPWLTRYREAGIAVVRPGAFDEEHEPADVWLVDSYVLPAFEGGRRRGTWIARIDDHGISPPDPVDLLLDQNLGASAETYADREVASDLLLGLRYALLRAELVEAAASRSRSGASPARLIVLQGGSPSPEVRAFFDAVVAYLHPAVATVEVLDGSADPVAALASADVALAASGSSSWELCLFGVPAVLVAASPNQEPLGRALAGAGAARYAGTIGEADPATVATEVVRLVQDESGRREMGGTARTLVDGRGARRVATRLRSRLVSLRAATAADSERVWRWNNDPLVRAASTSTADIPWQDHERWYAARLAEPGSTIFVASDDRGDLGVVRFAIDDAGRAEAGVALAAERRGEGWGAAVIDAGYRAVIGRDDVDVVIARIKPTNEASIDAFLDADFDLVEVAGDDGMHRYARRDG